MANCVVFIHHLDNVSPDEVYGPCTQREAEQKIADSGAAIMPKDFRVQIVELKPFSELS